MPIAIGAFAAAGAAVYRASHGDYSDYHDWRDYSNYSNYSDYAERQNLLRESKKKEISNVQKDLESYIRSQLNVLKREYQLTGSLPVWSYLEAEWNSFEADYSSYDSKLKTSIKAQLTAQLKSEIADDEQAIRALDDMLVKINRVKLLRKKGGLQ